MKLISLVLLLAIGGAAFYFAGGMQLLGSQEETALPETIDVPSSTFMGTPDGNPYAR